MFTGICKNCGKPINYELADVGIGVYVPHGWCSNPECPTYGWATDCIDRNKEEEYEENTIE